MINFTLYKREMKSSWKMLLIFAAILTLYISMVISMYDPKMTEMLNEFAKAMPELMSAIGMSGGTANLTEFMSTYLYGMILLMFPMVFTIIRANNLISRYVDRGSMVTLVAAPVKRTTVAFTQMKVLGTGIFALVLFAALLEIVCSAASFPEELDLKLILILNLGLLSLHLFIGGICFLCSCIFSDSKYSVGFGAGIPLVMFILQILSNVGGDAEKFKYATFFTLFNPDGLIAGEASAITGMLVLFGGTILLFIAAIIVFNKKDLHI